MKDSPFRTKEGQLAAADIVKTPHGPATARVALEMGLEDNDLKPTHLNRKGRKVSEYFVTCLCGVQIISPTEEVKCAACGREIRIDWQGAEG